MRPIEVGDWVEALDIGCPTSGQGNEPSVGERFLARALQSRKVFGRRCGNNFFCDCDVLRFVGDTRAANACCFVPIFPRLCEETTSTDVKEPTYVR